MNRRNKMYKWTAAVAIFFVLPLIIYTAGDFPRRGMLKESISIITIIAFFVTLLQFFLSRVNKPILNGCKMSKVIVWHKSLGYVFVFLLLIHPFLIVLPRYFEAGVEPKDAFMLILSNLGQKGLFFGLLSWALLLFLGLTSLFRNLLPVSYKTWRLMHGLLSVLFLAAASIHVISTGRHINLTMSWLIAVLSITGIFLLVRQYLIKHQYS